MAFLDDVKAKVEAAQTVEEGFVHYVEGLCDKFSAALKHVDVATATTQAKAIVDEAKTRVQDFVGALLDNTQDAGAPLGDGGATGSGTDSVAQGPNPGDGSQSGG